MTHLPGLDELLHAQQGDAGCDAGIPIMDQYVEIELPARILVSASPEPRSTCAYARAVAPITTACLRPPGASGTSGRSSAGKTGRRRGHSCPM